MRLPYGISNFGELRRHGYVYADKTGFIPRLEDAEKGRRYLVFLRPRRMGKTLLLSMLEHYYDVLSAPHFDELFGGLTIADAPTEERGSYAVLRLEFTGITTDEGIKNLRAGFYARLHNNILGFLSRYHELLPEVVAAFDAGMSTDAPTSLMDRFLQAMRRSSYQLYLLVDEYDNFTNETDRAVVHASGFRREFYKTIKEGAARGVVGRSFMTGISEGTLEAITSGFNIAKNISLHEDFNTLCGFTADDVESIVASMFGNEGCSLAPAAVLADLRRYDNGCLFSRYAAERVFNHDVVLHRLTELAPGS